MKNSRKRPTKQLEKYSNIFTQLGLVLVLFIVYITLEHETAIKTAKVLQPIDTKTFYLEPDRIVKFVKEETQKSKQNLPKKTQKLILDEVKKEDNEITENIVDFKDEDVEIVDIDKVEFVEGLDDDPIIEDVPFDFVQNAPIFKGCENLSKEGNRLCFDKKMKQFVHRHFDIELANEIGLRSGKHKIQTQFIIDDKGNVVDIKIRTAYKALQKEANRIIKKLPKFKPGKQNSRTVKVRYNLPISFYVE